jgi:hypothetical protein
MYDINTRSKSLQIHLLFELIIYILFLICKKNNVTKVVNFLTLFSLSSDII